ncbi:MAG: galactonate dehydratase [Anaerolineae bacterium]
MKITDIETIAIRPRWLVVRLHTDEGVTGYGEPTLEGHIPAVVAEIGCWRDYLIGADPRRIQHHWQALFRQAFYRGGPVQCSAISGLEQAMWDIVGKWLGVPVWALLGGRVRDRIRMYRHVGGGGPEQVAASAREAVAQGFTAVKMGVTEAGVRTIDTPALVERAVAQIAAVREAVGSAVEIGVDMHGRLSPAMAIRIAKAIEPYSPMFIEEPCLPENVDTMATVARATSIPVATGERLLTKWGFREVLEKQAATVLQPDPSHVGGILESRFIGAMAETYYAALAPHCPLGPVALAACLQVDACTPNFLIQEHVTRGEGYLRLPLAIDGGSVAVPEGPGLGLDIDEEALAAGADEGLWSNPRCYCEDGSVSDW